MGKDYKWNSEIPIDRRLMPNGPKRILSLDGGGIRGLLTCGILESIETELRERIRDPEKREKFVLADYFDLICGTSTGSIIAAWLALGKSVKELKDLYLQLGPNIFGERKLGGKLWVNEFDAELFEEQLFEHLGHESLGSAKLKTGLGVTAKRMDTGSAWLLANNPRAEFWSDQCADGTRNYHPNRDYSLRDIVRASAAAPAYFSHVAVEIEKGIPGETAPTLGAFMDGAIAGLNNPSMAFFLYATWPGYGLNWPVGSDKILLISVGTGDFRERFPERKLKKMMTLLRAVRSLASSIQTTSKNQLRILQALGHCVDPYPIDSEWDSVDPEHTIQSIMGPENAPFRFQRYDAPLEARALAEAPYHLQNDGEPLGPRSMKNLRQMDCVNGENLKRLRLIGERAGAEQVKPYHFPSAFKIEGMKH
jgi:predicted acylesterase/phospholipase RssA